MIRGQDLEITCSGGQCCSPTERTPSKHLIVSILFSHAVQQRLHDGLPTFRLLVSVLVGWISGFDGRQSGTYVHRNLFFVTLPPLGYLGRLDRITIDVGG